MGIATVGYSIFRDLDLDATGIVVKNSPGMLFGWHLDNDHASALLYVKFYDIATVPTHGNTPVLTIAVTALVPQFIEFSRGIIFSSGIAVRCTTERADNGETGAASDDMLAQVFFV